ncbi:solute:sodium symporter family transporter [Chitinophaga caseinilytica]|uniref:solute:sodium symporter family transporter n=1 Tax=Chitinophaga caseinilytica TaxID=2267521 RepID=UPI003C2F90BF
MNAVTLIAFFITVATAAWLVWRSARRTKPLTAAGLFFGNRDLGFVAVGCGLIFANINTTSFIGENELTFTNNMSVMAWGVTSVVVMMVVAEFILPIYLKTGISTTPDFLEMRYDRQTKTFVSLIFLLNYIVNLLPSVLYGAAVALEGLFGVSELTGLGYWPTIWLLVAVMGALGTLFSLRGGLKGMTVSGTMLGLAMFTGGLLLPYFALRHLGSGSWQTGLETVLTTEMYRLNAIGGPHDAIPFGTIFTGMLLVNLYYWSTEQYIVQQALGSRDLASCQKGMALAGLGKLVLPLLLNVPGIVAAHIYGSLPHSASVFSTLIRDVAPPVYTGFMAALLAGASLTTFIAGINSSATLYVLNLRKGAPGGMRTARRFEVLLCASAVCIAPFIHFTQGGLYTWLQKVGALFSVPIFTIMVVGFLTRRVPALAAKVGLAFFIACYAMSQFVVDVGMHFLHVLAILFVATVLLMLAIGKWRPREAPFVLQWNNLVEVTPWKWRYLAMGLLIALVIGLYVVFSPLGLAK